MEIYSTLSLTYCIIHSKRKQYRKHKQTAMNNELTAMKIIWQIIIYVMHFKWLRKFEQTFNKCHSNEFSHILPWIKIHQKCFQIHNWVDFYVTRALCVLFVRRFITENTYFYLQIFDWNIDSPMFLMQTKSNEIEINLATLQVQWLQCYIRME